jgi:hypothetical protein
VSINLKDKQNTGGFMKKFIYPGFIFAICLLLVSCTTGLKQSEIDPWLADISGANPRK